MNTKQPEAKRSKITNVALADAYPITRLGFVQLLNRQPGLQVCGEAATVSETLKLVRTVKVGLLILDPDLPDSTGFQLIKAAKAEAPALKVLVASTRAEPVQADLALHAGADGYVRKTEPLDDILRAVRRVLEGQLYLNANLTEHILRARVDRKCDSLSSPVDRLSRRELEVFGLIGQWQRTRDIAQQLHLSVKTVEYYRHNIKEKLHLTNATELTRVATQWCQHKPAQLEVKVTPQNGEAKPDFDPSKAAPSTWHRTAPIPALAEPCQPYPASPAGA